MQALSEGIVGALDPDHTYIATDRQRGVGDRIQVARILAGKISAERLAREVNAIFGTDLDRSTMASRENGRKRFSLTDLERISTAFREGFGLEFVTVDWLLAQGPGSIEGSPGYLGDLTLAS